MASRRVGYPVVVSWPSVFIINVSQVSVRIVTSLPSSFTSTTLVHFCSSFNCIQIEYWVFIIACARSIFAADAIQSGLNGSQLAISPIVLVK